MNTKNLTCTQKVYFVFDFFEKREWQPGEEPPFNRIVKVNQVEPEAVRSLNRFLIDRLERIAKMMDILLSAHDSWSITGKKDKIIMATDSFDFNDALQLLKEHGFHDDEFVLKVEYERKWGIL